MLEYIESLAFEVRALTEAEKADPASIVVAALAAAPR